MRLMVEFFILTLDWDIVYFRFCFISNGYKNAPVLPPSYKVGVFHQVAINILHVVTGMRCYQAKGDKESLVKILGMTTHT